jgi:hypothetical protein
MKRQALTVALSVALSISVSSSGGAQSVRYIDGVFVAPMGEPAPVELIAYAERMRSGVLRMQHGTLEDAPVVHEISGAFVSVPGWQPAAVLVATLELFRDELAERRNVPFATHPRNVYAVAIRIADFERRDRIDELLRAVKASQHNPGFAFIVIASENHVKYFPVRLTPDE